ncbi:MAG: hypothetical protein HC923_07310 [Myxococcales bacterium]|nr:hypothetical protein [Myxococcales bacterium]
MSDGEVASAETSTEPSPEQTAAAAETAATPAPTITVEELAEQLREHPTVGERFEVLVTAERQGLGRAMRKWLLANTKTRPSDANRLLARARGRVAFERGAWPPPPQRGSSYASDEWRGVLRSMEAAPGVAEVLALAKRWRDDLASLGVAHYFHDTDLSRDAQREVESVTVNYARKPATADTLHAALAELREVPVD